MGSEFQYRLKKIAGLARGKVILDVGFGDFPNPFLRNAIGVDLRIPKKIPNCYKKVVKGSVYDLPFSKESVDTVVLSGVIEHLENPVEALKEINRVLKNGGMLLMETPNPYFLPVIISDMLMNTRYYFRDTHLNLFPRRIMLKILWRTNFDLDKIVSCGTNLNNYITIPTPQQLAQDIIYVVKKRPIRNKKRKIIASLFER